MSAGEQVVIVLTALRDVLGPVNPWRRLVAGVDDRAGVPAGLRLAAPVAVMRFRARY